MVNAAKSLLELDRLVGQVSEVTGLSQDEISEHMESANIKSFRFEDAILVSPEDFDSIIDAWAANIKERLRTPQSKRKKVARQSSAPRKVAPSPVQEETIDLSESVASTQEVSADPDSAELSWPKGYKKVVTHLYGPTLKKILPEDPDQERAILEAIAQETEVGEKLLDDLASAIVKRSKRRLALDSVKEGLKRKIQEMV